jgi:hypothetical protein
MTQIEIPINSSPLPIKLNLPLIQDSAKSLASVIQFIVEGKADDSRDYEAWDQRVLGGKCAYRLKKMLNYGELVDVDASLKTVQRLERLWCLVKMLGHGSHHKNPNEYYGPFFLPNEVAPNGRLRKFDEEYIAFADLGLDIPERFSEQLTDTKATSWSYFPEELLLMAWLLDPKSGVIERENPEYNKRELIEKAEAPSIEAAKPMKVLHQNCPISPELRTREMSKQEAARYMGIRKADYKNPQRQLSNTIERLQRESKEPIFWEINRQRFIFDYRLFPEETWSEIGARSDRLIQLQQLEQTDTDSTSKQ